MPEAGKLIDGKAIAAEIRREIREEVSRRVALGRTPGLAVIVVGDNPASKVYVNMKKKACEEAGMNGKIVRLPAGISQEELLQEVSSLNRDPKWHGFLVQSPLPDGLDEDEVVRAIDPMKDVDGFHPYNVGLLAAGEPRFVPCTPSVSWNCSNGARWIPQENMRSSSGAVTSWDSPCRCCWCGRQKGRMPPLPSATAGHKTCRRLPGRRIFWLPPLEERILSRRR